MHLRSLALNAAVLLTLGAAGVRAQSIDNAGCCDVQVPEPFQSVEPAAFIRALYPGYDPQTRLLGNGIVGKDGKPLGGQLYDAALWKGVAEPRLLALVESYAAEDNGARPGYGAAAYGLDLAAFDLEGGAPKLVAKLQNADTHSGHSDMAFDQAPYRVTPEIRAFGLRETYLHMGHRTERLKLFMQEGATFRPIFERVMYDSLKDAYTDPLEGDLDAQKMKEIYEDNETYSFNRQAVLAVVPGQGGANDFKVTEKTVERQADGKLVKGSVAEIWSWDPQAKVYTKRP
jgi:hypothetical protein